MYLLSALICLWMLVLTVTQCTMQARNSRTLRAVVTLLNSVEGQLTSSSMTSSLSLTGMLDSDKIEGTLQCIDAKMLQLSTESQQLRAHVSDLQANDKLSSLDLTMQRVLDLADNATKLMEAWTKEIPPRIKDIYQFTSGLNTTHKAVSVMALDMQKSFSLQETLSDGLLRQGREALQHTQSEQKSQAEKLNELKTDQKAQAEKLGELKVITKVITEELRNSIKQVSLDVHVSRTKSEQKTGGAAERVYWHGGSHSVLFPRTECAHSFLEGIERLHEQRHPIPRAGEPTRPQDEGGPANLERELSQH